MRKVTKEIKKYILGIYYGIITKRHEREIVLYKLLLEFMKIA